MRKWLWSIAALLAVGVLPLGHTGPLFMIHKGVTMASDVLSYLGASDQIADAANGRQVWIYVRSFKIESTGLPAQSAVVDLGAGAKADPERIEITLDGQGRVERIQWRPATPEETAQRAHTNENQRSTR